MDNEMERFREVFFEEAAEHVASMESALLELEHSPENHDLLHTIFRAAHTLKGASGTFGFDEVARFTHCLENLLDRMREGTIDSSPERLDLLLRSADVLRGLLGSAKTGQPAPRGVEAVLAELQGILSPDAAPVKPQASSSGPSVAAARGEYRVVFTPDADLLRQGMDPLLLLRDLAKTGEIVNIRLDISRLPPLIELEPENCYLSWSLHLKTEQTASEVEEVFAYVRDSIQVAIEPVLDPEPWTNDGGRSVEAEALPESLEVPSHSLLATAHDLIEAAIILVRAETCLAMATVGFAASEVFSGRGEQEPR